MAELWRERGFVIKVNSNDHPPPHVHARKGRGNAIVYLGDTEEDSPTLHKFYGITRKDALVALEIVCSNPADAWAGWRRIHEPDQTR
jgi:hypothetical protein